MTNHTPTPWEVDGDEIRTPEPQGYLVARVTGETDQEACATARFIVRAVNAHEELLFALKMARRMLDTWDDDRDFPEWNEAKQVISQAIAKAEKGA